MEGRRQPVPYLQRVASGGGERSGEPDAGHAGDRDPSPGASTTLALPWTAWTRPRSWSTLIAARTVIVAAPYSLRARSATAAGSPVGRRQPRSAPRCRRRSPRTPRCGRPGERGPSRPSRRYPGHPARRWLSGARAEPEGAGQQVIRLHRPGQWPACRRAPDKRLGSSQRRVADGFTDRRPPRYDLRKRRDNARSGHAMGMIKLSEPLLGRILCHAVRSACPPEGSPWSRPLGRTISLGIGQIAADEAAEQPT